MIENHSSTLIITSNILHIKKSVVTLWLTRELK